MAIYNITSEQLKGTGILNSFEIATGGGSGTKQSLFINTAGGFLGTTSTSQSDFYNNATGLSVSFWIKATADTGTWVPYSRRRPGPRGVGAIEAQIQLSKTPSGGGFTGGFQFFFGDGYIGQAGILALGTLNMTQWNHVVMTYDSTAPALKIYLNGSRLNPSLGKGDVGYFYGG